MTSTSDLLLLELDNLVVEFSQGRRRPPLRAVDGVSLQLGPRETLGIVGESGSGKTTIGRAILGLVPVHSGRVFFRGRDITWATQAERRALSSEMQVVFQNPYGSLNPTRTIGQTLSETLRAQGIRSREAVRERMHEMLERVGLPADAATRYPAHFSGGQRQRIAIARALMASPRFVVCDEPTSALDLSVQAQVMNLLRELQAEFGLSYVFISHDLGVVRHLSHRILVLYHGRVMEQGDARQVSRRPTHPYTRALLEASPIPDPKEQRQRRVARLRTVSSTDEIPSPSSCPFAARCPHTLEICRTDRPSLEHTPEGTLVACHRWQELRAAPLNPGRGQNKPLPSQVGQEL